jgi:hypothetical protein
MENQQQSPNNFLKILSGAGRYILGLIIVLSPLITSLLEGFKPDFLIMGLLTPPNKSCFDSADFYRVLFYVYR